MDEFGCKGADELRASLQEYFRSQGPQAPAEPLAPGISPSDSQKVRDESGALYAASILRKPAGQITPQERDFLANGIRAALNNLGY